MRRPSSALPAVLLTTTILVGGCQSADRPAPADQPARDVQLIEPAAPTTVGISDLEAGRPLTAAPRSERPRPTPAPAPEVTPPAEATVAEEPVPELSTTSTAEAELVAAPEAAGAGAGAADEDVVVVSARPIQPTYAIDVNPSLDPNHGRGPIIIRGGRGGIYDDCDLHRPVIRRNPTAIHRVGIR